MRSSTSVLRCGMGAEGRGPAQSVLPFGFTETAVRVASQPLPAAIQRRARGANKGASQRVPGGKTCVGVLIAPQR